jgi:tRNA(Ile)-lysidine synthase
MDDLARDPVLRRFYFRFERALRALLPEPDPHLLGAISGGCDSVALACLLREAAARGRARVTLGHVHHGLRAEADEDQAFVQRLAEAWGLPILTERVDAAALAAARGWSPEHAARALRLQALERMARACDAHAVALGHHMDDQAETVLLRLLRGVGPRGLGGIRPSRRLCGVPGERPIRLVRPLLEVRREALRAFAVRAGLSWREDASNRDPARPRNRIRHELLPHLQRAYNPRLVEALAAAAHDQRLESALVARAAARVLARVRLAAGPGGVEIDAVRLAREPDAIATQVLWRAYQAVAGTQATLGHRHSRALLAALRGAARGAPRAVHLPGRVRARCTRDRVILEPHRPRPGAAAPGQESA